MRKLLRMPAIPHLVTAEELERYPEDDHRYELVDGRLVAMSPMGYWHGRTVVRLAARLEQHLAGRSDGVVVTEVGFVLARHPDTVRAPDLAFVRRDHIPAPDARGFLQGTPDLAVEVASPEDRPGALRARANEYLSRGVLVVLVIDPDERTATLFRRLGPALILTHEDDVLEIEDVVDGFRCRLGELFD